MSLARVIALPLLLVVAGCPAPTDQAPLLGPLHWSPFVRDGDAGCEVDPLSGEIFWYFQAEVDDWDGLADIVAVGAEVSDAARGERVVDVFELAPIDPGVWFGEWPERQTLLDCHADGYTVDLVVWDRDDGYDILGIRPRHDE